MSEAPEVCLAISSFRNDEAVTRLLRDATRDDAYPFAEILVVDSRGTGEIPRLIESQGWKNVTYHSADVNLGSAGNLAKRLELAAELDCKYVYALNHDGYLDSAVIAELVKAAEALPKVGAAYPLRYLAQKHEADTSGRRGRIPMPNLGRSSVVDEEPYPVFWSSSNATLYALEPVRKGLLPWADLWMGWEDLGYGWLLRNSGYEQVVVPTAVWRDDYEYRPHRVLGRTLHLTQKPPWYAYYQARNLLLIARRLHSPPTEYAVLTLRLLMEVGATALFRNDKLTRYRLLAAGVLDGLRARAGKGRVP